MNFPFLEEMSRQKPTLNKVYEADVFCLRLDILILDDSDLGGDICFLFCM